MSNKKEVLLAKITVLEAERELVEARDYETASRERAAELRDRINVLEERFTTEMDKAVKHRSVKEKKLADLALEIDHLKKQAEEMEG